MLPSSAGMFLIYGKVISKIWQGGKFTLAEILPRRRGQHGLCVSGPSSSPDLHMLLFQPIDLCQHREVEETRIIEGPLDCCLRLASAESEANKNRLINCRKIQQISDTR